MKRARPGSEQSGPKCFQYPVCGRFNDSGAHENRVVTTGRDQSQGAVRKTEALIAGEMLLSHETVAVELV